MRTAGERVGPTSDVQGVPYLIFPGGVKVPYNVTYPVMLFDLTYLEDK